jgi:putative addiction module killer protein
MIYDIQTTDLFTEWVKNLKDRQAAMAIAKRLDRVSKGHLGDVFPVGDGVSEMRFSVAQVTGCISRNVAIT